MLLKKHCLPVAHEGAGDTVERGEVALDEVHRVNPGLQGVHPSFLTSEIPFSEVDN